MVVNLLPTDRDINCTIYCKLV